MAKSGGSGIIGRAFAGLRIRDVSRSANSITFTGYGSDVDRASASLRVNGGYSGGILRYRRDLSKPFDRNKWWEITMRKG